MSKAPDAPTHSPVGCFGADNIDAAREGIRSGGNRIAIDSLVRLDQLGVGQLYAVDLKAVVAELAELRGGDIGEVNGVLGSSGTGTA